VGIDGGSDLRDLRVRHGNVKVVPACPLEFHQGPIADTTARAVKTVPVALDPAVVRDTDGAAERSKHQTIVQLLQLRADRTARSGQEKHCGCLLCSCYLGLRLLLAPLLG